MKGFLLITFVCFVAPLVSALPLVREELGRMKQHPVIPLQGGAPCSLSLAHYDSGLPDKVVDNDNLAWNYNFLTSICAIEELVANKQIAFYYPVEGTIIALMRYGRNVGHLSAGKNIVEHANDIDIMVEIPNGQSVDDTVGAIRDKMKLRGYSCGPKKNGRRDCFSTKWFTCSGMHGSEKIHADFEFYTTTQAGDKVYALTGCYDGLVDADKERMPLYHIRDSQMQRRAFCAFLPSSLMVPCPIDAAEMSRVWQNFDDSRDGKMQHVVLPDQFGYKVSDADRLALKRYAKMLGGIGALNYGFFFE